MECNKESNLEDCNCSYPGCPRKGVCCECVAHHRKNNEIPACFFPDDVERTFNRTFEKFAQLMDDLGFYWLAWNKKPLNVSQD